ncbi:ZIP family metal transporter [Herbaspirillum seropedicae]|uniref:ZIP family metal transporter n=1 Tax=Herbaspirillum seropedicae TaxID=964 RepID=UPI00111F97FF|nr:ZIP family metal transporter [Herbaspirillum seropedicae]QDD63183.1 ZIP family metal transporter [Herbaspirillum seropedicae]
MFEDFKPSASSAATSAAMAAPAGAAGLAAEHRMPIRWPMVALALTLACAAMGWWSVRDPRIWHAYCGGMAAAAATAAGTLPLFFSRRFSARMADCCTGFGAGVMLAASVFSLILPALQSVRTAGMGQGQASLVIGASVVAGALLVLLLQRAGQGHDDAARQAALRRVWLFVLTVGLHNLPEGLAVGVAYGGVPVEQASVLTFGIALQDIPEGMIVATALRGIGYSRADAIGCGILSGLVEPLAAVAGAAVVALSSALLPWALGGAAGAMLFVLAYEVIPDPHRRHDALAATCCLIAGFVLMMVLDTALS